MQAHDVGVRSQPERVDFVEELFGEMVFVVVLFDELLIHNFGCILRSVRRSTLKDLRDDMVEGYVGERASADLMF